VTEKKGERLKKRDTQYTNGTHEKRGKTINNPLKSFSRKIEKYKALTSSKKTDPERT